MPSQCDTCQGKFGVQFFSDSPHCRLCHLQSQMDRLHEKYEEKCQKYHDLSHQFEVLKEFVSANIGCSLDTDATPANPTASADTATISTSRTDAPFTLVKN